MQKLGAIPTKWHEYRNDWKLINAEVIEETLISIYVNGVELATIMATPYEQDKLALGFLKNEGFLDEIQEVEEVYISHKGCCVDVWLNHLVTAPKRVIITSGCGGGVTFDDPSIGIEPLEDDLTIDPELLKTMFNQLQSAESLYARARGVHTSGLIDPQTKNLIIMAEDIGRHNTIDKVAGACLLDGIDPKGSVLLATGRVSSEMIRKGALMGCPIIASRNSPTSLSIEIAEAWNITLVGYVRRGSMRVYTHPYRLGYNDSQKSYS